MQEALLEKNVLLCEKHKRVPPVCVSEYYKLVI